MKIYHENNDFVNEKFQQLQSDVLTKTMIKDLKQEIGKSMGLAGIVWDCDISQDQIKKFLFAMYPVLPFLGSYWQYNRSCICSSVVSKFC